MSKIINAIIMLNMLLLSFSALSMENRQPSSAKSPRFFTKFTKGKDL